MFSLLQSFVKTNRSLALLLAGIILTAILLIIFAFSLVSSPDNNASSIQPTNPSPAAQKPSLNPTQVQQLQTTADRDFAAHQKELDKNFPWLDKLPLQKDEYFVFFDTDKKQFVGKLYPKTSGGSIDDQVALLKNQVIEALKAQGIPSDQYPISWIITPEPE